MKIDKKVIDWLGNHESYLLAGHSGPDGDCLGSMVAMQDLLLGLGKDVTILLEKEPSPEFSFLAGLQRVKVWDGGDLPAIDLLVLLDCSTPGRAGSLAAPLAGVADKMLVIDHHQPDQPPTANPDQAWYSDPLAASTTMLVLDLFDALERKPGPDAVLGLLTGLLTDTYWLQNSNADARAIACLARIMNEFNPGMGPGRIYDLVCRSLPAGVHELLATALSRIVRADGLAMTWLKEKDITDAGLETFESELIMRSLMSVKWVRAGLLIYEKEPGRQKFSLRSRGGGEALAMAKRLGGGGHREAAGASIECPTEEACQRALKEWRELT